MITVQDKYFIRKYVFWCSVHSNMFRRLLVRYEKLYMSNGKITYKISAINLYFLLIGVRSQTLKMYQKY